MPPVDVVRPGSDPRFQSALDEDELILVHPPAIPIPPTSVENLSDALSSLRSAASEISQAGQDIKSTWQGLQDHYSAPEAEDLFAALNPVETTGDQVHDDLYDVVSALKTFSGTALRTQRRLKQLRSDAWDLADEAAGDPEWNSDRALAARNGALKRAVNRQWALFQEAERECGNTIRDVCGLTGDYTAASADGAPGPNDIVWGIDPADVADPGYDLTTWADWKRLWEDNNHYVRDADMPWPLDWTRDAFHAQWDYFGGGMVWGLGVSAVSATGAWSQEGGWASSIGEAKDNAIAHQEEKIQGLGALAGLYGEDGWMNPFSGPEAWNWEGDAWQANAGAAWTEVAHEFWPWREWENHPAYTVYTGLGNAALTVVAFPVRGGTLLARLGGGGLNDLGGVGGPDGLSPDGLSTHWPNGVAGRPGFSLSEHLSNATGRPSGVGTDLSERLRGLRDRLASWSGTSTGDDAPHGGPSTRADHGTGDPSDGHAPQTDGLEGSPSPNRGPSPTGTPERSGSTDESAPVHRDRTDAEEERQVRELAEEIAEAERYGIEEYLRQRADQPVLVGAGGGPMEINGHSDSTVTNSAGDGDGPSRNGTSDNDPVTIRGDDSTNRQVSVGTLTGIDSNALSSGGRALGGNNHDGSGLDPSQNPRSSWDSTERQIARPDINKTPSNTIPVREGHGLSPRRDEPFTPRNLDPNQHYEVFDENGRRRGIFSTDTRGDIVEVRTFPGQSFDRNPDLKNPLPKASYIIDSTAGNGNKFVFQTDGRSRTIRAYGTLDLLPKSEDRYRDGGDQTGAAQVGVEYFSDSNGGAGALSKMFSQVAWNGGHLIGTKFGGTGHSINLVAQLESTNQHARGPNTPEVNFRDLEKYLARELRANKKVEVEIECLYSGSSDVPTVIRVMALVDGKPPVFRARVDDPRGGEAEYVEREMPIIDYWNLPPVKPGYPTSELPEELSTIEPEGE